MSITKSKAVTLATTVAFGGVFAVLGTTFDCRNNTTVSFRLTYVKGGSATGATLVLEGTQVKDDWTNPVEVPIALDFSGTLTAGVVNVPLGKMRYTLDTAGSYHFAIDSAGMHQLRWKGLEGGTPGGTLTIVATGVQESAR